MPLLTNPLASADQLSSRLSSNIPTEALDAVFVATQCLTQAAGILLELPQSVTAQANVILARYWVSAPLGEFEFSDLSAAAIYVVSKDSPSPRSPRDLCSVYTYLCSSSSSFFKSEPPPRGHPSSYCPSEGSYASFHSRLIEAEASMLHALGYDTTVALPHPLAVTYLQALDFAGKPRKEITSRAVAYLNTALLSPQVLYLTHQPGELATAAIFLAARDVGAGMPPEPWWELFDVDREQLGFLACSLNSVDSLMRKQREDFKFIADGMVTRKKLEEALGTA
ncbi:hypothetical protein VUR80DRAFT_5451 [Thermomyces stellatus]